MDAIGNMLDRPLFNIGDTQTRVGSLLAAIVIFIATLLLTRLVRRAVDAVAKEK